VVLAFCPYEKIIILLQKLGVRQRSLHSHGQGLETRLAQIAHEVLGSQLAVTL
jgi:hypothetical protein